LEKKGKENEKEKEKEKEKKENENDLETSMERRFRIAQESASTNKSGRSKGCMH
jgi:hypothetical protein